MHADCSKDCIDGNTSISNSNEYKNVLVFFAKWGISKMSENDSEPEPTPVSDDLGETKLPPTHPVDFTDTVERLKDRASASRRASKGNKTNSTVVAFLAVSALLMVVVGAEDVVRRELVPDIADTRHQIGKSPGEFGLMPKVLDITRRSPLRPNPAPAAPR